MLVIQAKAPSVHTSASQMFANGSPFSETRTVAVVMIEVRALSRSKAVSLVWGACELHKLVAQQSRM